MNNIIKAYDIRGIVGQNLTEDIAYKIGIGLAQEIFEKNNPIIISHDARIHSIALTQALIRGLNENGCSTYNIGLASTPMNYWANVYLKAAGSIQVTASHNGPEYNGFKISRKNALPVGYDNGLKELEIYIKEPNLQKIPSEGNNQNKESLLGEYLEFMKQFINLGKKRLKIVIDAGNGMAGHFLPSLQNLLSDSIDIIPLYWELDGTFPNHEPDPMKEENLSILKEKVKEYGADCGVAFDGDADRCVFIDEKGQFISSDLIVAFLAQDFLKNSSKQETIIYDLRSSAIVKEVIEENGGIAIASRVGHSFMKAKLRETNAIFGGELSGHYYFADCFFTDSGFMALIKVINLLSNTNQLLSELILPLRKYHSTNEVNFKVQNAKEILTFIQAKYKSECLEISHLDGLLIKFTDWWILLRESNTEPLLRLTLESHSAQICKEKFEEVSAIINSFHS